MAYRRAVFSSLIAVVALTSACTTKTAQHVAVQALPQSTPTTTKPALYRQLVWANVPKVQVFQAPGVATPVGALKNPTAEAQPLAFLAVGQQGEWTQVRLPVRPNGAVGWVKTADLKMDQSPAYRILVELAAHKLTLFKGDQVVMQEPVGIGKVGTPTPTGNFYVDALVQLDNPNTVWGPYQMSVSGFSNVLERFGGGPGQIAIHGTNTPQLIPGDVSHGCVRMKNAALTKLVELTGIGTPVDIVA